MGNTVWELHEKGQSIWCDNISRGMIDSGELNRLIELGLVGVTSNPTIFMKAITTGSDYDERFNELIELGKDEMGIYEGLVLPDIADAADILRPVYDETKGVDGYVSLEVNPKLAYDAAATVQEARRLHTSLGRPNVLIKVPATKEGMPAIATLISEGISVNATLIFSLAAYAKVIRAYIDGLTAFDTAGGDLSAVTSVASFFVSRVDTLVDKLLDEQGEGGAKVDHLLGRAAVANAKLAYARFEGVFGGTGGFAALASRGAHVQRPVWASTSTKNPAYPDTKYVDGLVGPNTVNTLPPETIEAALDHGKTEVSLRSGLNDAKSLFQELSQVGVDIDAVTEQLRVDGVAAFAKSFEDLLANLTAKREKLRAAT